METVNGIKLPLLTADEARQANALLAALYRKRWVAVGAEEDAPKPAPAPSKDRFHELVAEMVETHDTKNKDYADSKKDPLRNFRRCEKIGYPAHIGCFTRMGDKWMRCENLLARMNAKKKKNRRGPAVKNESIIDTLKDLSVYCLIMIELLEQYEAKQAKKQAKKEQKRAKKSKVAAD